MTQAQPNRVEIDLAGANITASDVTQATHVTYRGVTLYEITHQQVKGNKRYNLVPKTGYEMVGLTKAKRGEVAQYLRMLDLNMLGLIMDKMSSDEAKAKIEQI
jgi:hypothetical protein